MNTAVHTKLIYFEDMQRLIGKAKVLSVEEYQDKLNVVLDETVFYPQGGGQPYDQGLIENESGRFIVSEVRFADGIVNHIGYFERGTFNGGQTVSLEVNPERRMRSTRFHSGGHVLDMAINELGLKWNPGKGYHFPEGPYIEYEGAFDENEKENLKLKIQAKANELISLDIPVTVRFMPKSEIHTVCAHVPNYLPEDKPARVVFYGNFGVPCGGTHVASLKVIGNLKIRKISSKKGIIKVAYDLN